QFLTSPYNQSVLPKWLDTPLETRFYSQSRTLTMPSEAQFSKLNRNKILSMLPADEYTRIVQTLKPVHLSEGNLLYKAGEACEHAWFLLRGLVSVLAVSKDGEALDVGMIGAEGVAGILAALQD